MDTTPTPTDSVRRLSPRALRWLKHFEQSPRGGFAATPYPDGAGHPTIGWGHVVGRRERFDVPIDAAAAEALLRADLRVAELYVDALAIELDQHQFDALVLFAFNLGVGALDRSTLLKRIREAAPLTQIARQFMRWVYLRNPLRQADGLKRRRAVEFLIYAGRDDAYIDRANAALVRIAAAGIIGAGDLSAAMGLA